MGNNDSIGKGEHVRHRSWKLGLVGVMLFLVSICSTPGRAGKTEEPVRSQYALGAQRVLVLAVSFPGVPTDMPLRKVKERALDNVADYYAKASYGKTTITGEVKGWYQLPRPLEDYRVSPYNINVDPARVRQLLEDAFSAAEKEVSFNQYNHIIVVVGVRTSPGVGYGMIAYSANPGMLQKGLMRKGRAKMDTIITRGGQSFNRGIIVVAQNALLGHIVHDLAHAMGGTVEGKRPIPDLYDTVAQGKVGPLTHESYPKFAYFMGPWDVMSQHFTKRDQPPPGMSSFTRLRMGWIGDEQVVKVSPGESRAVTLQPLGTGRGILVIRVPGRGGTYYLIENQQELPGGPELPVAGLLVLHVDESREDGDGIVRVVDANPKVPHFGAATYGVGLGQTPSVNLSRDMAVEVLWQRNMDLTVMVTEQSRAPEVQAVAKRIREINDRLQALPESLASAQARAELTNAMELLLQLKVSDARGKLDNIEWP